HGVELRGVDDIRVTGHGVASGSIQIVIAARYLVVIAVVQIVVSAANGVVITAVVHTVGRTGHSVVVGVLDDLVVVTGHSVELRGIDVVGVTGNGVTQGAIQI